MSLRPGIPQIQLDCDALFPFLYLFHHVMLDSQRLSYDTFNQHVLSSLILIVFKLMRIILNPAVGLSEFR